MDETNALLSQEEKTSFISDTILATKCTILISLCVLSFFANLLLIITIIKRKLYRYSSSRLIFSLTLSNLVANISVVPLMIYSTIARHWTFGDVGCKITGFLTHSIGYVSILTLCMLAIDRYQSISRPFYYRTSRNRTSVNWMLIWSWCQSITAAMPPLFNVGARYEYNFEVSICLISWDGNLIYTTLVLLFCIVFPTFPMVWCYWRIFKIARQKQKSRFYNQESSKQERPVSCPTKFSQFPGIEFNPAARKSFGRPVSKLICYNHFHESRRFTFSHHRSVSESSLSSKSERSQDIYIMNQDQTFFSRPPSTIFSDTSDSITRLTPQSSGEKANNPVRNKVTFEDLKQAFKPWKKDHSKSFPPTGSPTRTIRTLFVIVMSYLLTCGPYTTFILIRGYSYSTVIPEWYTVMAVYLLVISYFIHPLVYGFYSKTTRKEAYKAIILTKTFAKLFPAWYKAAKAKRQTKRVMKKITKINAKPIFYDSDFPDKTYRAYDSVDIEINGSVKQRDQVHGCDNLGATLPIITSNHNYCNLGSRRVSFP